MTYLESIKERQTAEAQRLARVREVAAYLCAYMPTWRQVQDEGLPRVELTNDRSTLVLTAKGDRLVVWVQTSRWVEFAPGDRDLVTAGAKEKTEITIAADRPLPAIARDVERRLLDVAEVIAARLDEEQENMAQGRRQGCSAIAEFRAQGWQITDRGHGHVYVYVPDEHALRTLGVYCLRVDPETGDMEYDCRPYLPSGTQPSDLFNINKR
jgi:hypothetical protein